MTQVRVGWRAYVNPFTPEDPGTPNTIDQDVTNFILASGISDSVQTSAIETLVSDLKSYGLWTKMKAVYPFVGGTAASHKWNLKDPRNLDAAYRLVFNGGWVHSSTGAKPNGSTGWATTYFNPVTQLVSQTSNHISTYLRTNIDELAVDMGSYADPGIGYDIESRIGNVSYNINGVQHTPLSFANTDSRGFYVNTRQSSILYKVFVSNVLKGSNTSTFNALPNTNVALAARFNVSIGTAYSFSTKEQAFASIGDGLTDAESANFYIAVQKFQTTLGRQVGTPYVSDPDAVAFLNAAGITDGTQASAINTLVIRMKADGVWTKMKAIYPFVGGSANSHKFNLKDPRDSDAAFRLGFYGGWTHTSTGALPNGTTGYADTNVTPSSRLASTSGFGFYSRTNSTVGSQADMGALYYFPIQAFGSSAVGTTRYFASNSNDYSSFTDTDTRGFYQTYRTDSTTVKSLKNTTLYSATLSYATPNLDILIGARNEIGVAQVFSLKEFAFAYVQENFTDSDATALYSTVQAFQTTLGRQVNIPVVSDTDAQTFLNAANITSFQQASAVNKLVVDLKAAGVWTKMKAIYPFVGGSAASHKFNLKDPRDLDAAYRLVFNGGWTHTGTGAQPNGTTGYADTKWTQSINGTINNQSLSVYNRTNNTYNGVDMGARVGLQSDLSLAAYGGSPIVGRINTYANSAQISGTITGFWQINRVNTLSQTLYLNNQSSTSTITTSTDIVNLPIYIGAMNVPWLNNAPTYAGYFSNREQAFASIGDGLTDGEATAFYTAVQTYQTSLGRAVNTPVYNNGLVLNLDAGNANSYPGTGTTWFDLATSTNGSLVNSPTFNSNQFTFNGTNQFVNFGNINNIGTDSVTLVAWIKTTGNQDYAGIIGKAFYGDKLGRFSLHTRSGGKLGIITQNTSTGDLQITEVISTQNINTGNWVFVVAVIDRSYGNKLYINGVLDGVSTRDTSGVNWSTTENFTIGYYNGNTGGYFNGSISNAFMYRRVLTNNEIINLYNSTRGRFGL